MSCRVCSCGDFAHVRPAAYDSADLKIVSKIVIFDFQNPVTFLLKRAPRSARIPAGLLAGPDRKDRRLPRLSQHLARVDLQSKPRRSYAHRTSVFSSQVTPVLRRALVMTAGRVSTITATAGMTGEIARRTNGRPQATGWQRD